MTTSDVLRIHIGVKVISGGLIVSTVEALIMLHTRELV